MSGGGEASQAPGTEPAREAWVWSAYVLALAALGLLLYLGSKPGGTGPIQAYRFGPLVLAGGATGVALWGLIQVLRRPPLARTGRASGFFAAVAVAISCSYPFPYPTSYEGRPSAVEFRLPFDGWWTVRWGGGRPRNSALVILPDRCRGYDFVRATLWVTRHMEGEGLEDYLAYGEPVLAPSPGRVVRVHTGEADRPVGAPAEGDGEPLGNYLVLEVAPDQWLFLSNLQAGSIAVEEGQEVRVGEPLARVGNSGLSAFSPEPHLALHLQDTPEPRMGEGIPLTFSGYETGGGRHYERGTPKGGVGAGGRVHGDRVRNAE